MKEESVYDLVKSIICCRYCKLSEQASNSHRILINPELKMPSVARYEKTITTVVKKVGEKLTLQPSKKVVKNRFMKGPMSEYITKFDPNDLKTSGIPTPAVVNLFEKYAAGGWGIVSTGMILVDGAGRGMFPGNFIIGPDEDSADRRAAFKQIVNVVKPYNALCVAQVGNIEDIGRYYGLPNIDDESAVRDALRDIIFASKFLNDCGFDGISMAAWPGETERNKALLRDTVTHIKKTVNNPSFVIGIKFNTGRYGDASKSDMLKLLEVIDNSGYDYVEIGGGSYEFPSKGAADREGAFADVVNEAKKHMKKTAVYVGGGMRRAKTMERLIADGIVDGITMARPAAAELDLPLKIIGNHVASTPVLPFEDDMGSGVLAAAAQAGQAGRLPLSESNRNVNYGIMDLNDPRVLEKFQEAKAKFVENAEANKAKGIVLPGVITVEL